MKAYGYIRTSTIDQKKKSGPDRQRENIERCAKALGYEIVKVYIDDVSGAIDCLHRPQFKAMISEILQDSINHFIVEDMARLARSVAVQEQILIKLAAKDIHLISAATDQDVTEIYQRDHNKKAQIQMEAVFSELEKNRLVARLQAGRRLSGKLGGRPPVYPKELVNRIKRLYARGRSYNYIADLFNKEGVKCYSKSGEWSPQLARMVAVGRKKKK